MPGDPDAPLLTRIAHGDRMALETLYERHGLRLLRYLIGQLGDSALAEEALQDVMLAVWQHADRFRGESRALTWLFSIARNRAINLRQKHTAEVLYTVPLDEALSIPLDAPDDAELWFEQDRLRQVFRELPVEQRETLELLFYHALTGPEAAAVMGVAPGTVKSRLNRALTTLKGWMLRKER